MRLLYFLRYYPTLSETFVMDEVRALQALGHTLRGVAIGARADGALNEELPSWPVLTPGWPQALGAAPRAPAAWSALRLLAAWQRPGRALKALAAAGIEVDQLHAHFAGEAAEWAWLTAQASGRPYTVTVHAADLFKPRPALPRVLHDAAAVFTVSAYNAEVLRARWGVQAQVIRCGIDPARWPAADPARPGPVVAVGRWVPKKGLDVLCRAAARVPGARLRLCSDAPAVPGVEVLGLQPRRVVAQELAQACLFALPCQEAADGDRDGLPVAMMEAMACGLPVLTTTLPGLEELVPEGCGWVVPPGDEDALAGALAEALASPEERARRGAQARAHVQAHFTLERQARALLRAWGAS